MERSIATTSLLLTAVAAYTDSATFVGAGKLFSAHVTGNFVVLAYDTIYGAGRNEWSKLLAFPVFFVGVMVAGRLANRGTGAVEGKGPKGGRGIWGTRGAAAPKAPRVRRGIVVLGLRGGAAATVGGAVEKAGGAAATVGGAVEKAGGGAGDRLLRVEGVLLLLGGVGAAGMRWAHLEQEWLMVIISMAIVVAMGFQNAFGRLFVKRVYGPTTVMTGNVTSAALDIAAWLLDRPRHPEKLPPLRHNLAMIAAFLGGCFLGGFCAYLFGLAAVVAPGLAVLGFFMRGR